MCYVGVGDTPSPSIRRQHCDAQGGSTSEGNRPTNGTPPGLPAPILGGLISLDIGTNLLSMERVFVYLDKYVCTLWTFNIFRCNKYFMCFVGVGTRPQSKRIKERLAGQVGGRSSKGNRPPLETSSGLPSSIPGRALGLRTGTQLLSSFRKPILCSLENEVSVRKRVFRHILLQVPLLWLVCMYPYLSSFADPYFPTLSANFLYLPYFPSARPPIGTGNVRVPSCQEALARGKRNSHHHCSQIPSPKPKRLTFSNPTTPQSKLT